MITKNCVFSFVWEKDHIWPFTTSVFIISFVAPLIIMLGAYGKLMYSPTTDGNDDGEILPAVAEVRYFIKKSNDSNPLSLVLIN